MARSSCRAAPWPGSTPADPHSHGDPLEIDGCAAGEKPFVGFPGEQPTEASGPGSILIRGGTTSRSKVVSGGTPKNRTHSAPDDQLDRVLGGP